MAQLLSPDALAGHVIIVTGAASGIGRATVETAAASGARVIAADIRKPEETVSSVLGSGGSAEGVTFDVGDRDAWDALASRVHGEHGRIDGLANVAGIAGGDDTILTQTDEAWDRIMRVNLRGTWYGMRAVLPFMLEAGAGRIVNTSSNTALVGMPTSFAYTTSKSALVGMTRQLAIEFASRGIRANVVAPGIVQTPMLGEAAEASVAAMRAATPVGRIGTPEEIAAMICFLLAPAGDYVTGQVMVVDGGWVAR